MPASLWNLHLEGKIVQVSVIIGELIHFQGKWGMERGEGESSTVEKLFCLPSEKGSTLKGKKLLPLLFSFSQKGLNVQGGK